MNYSYEDIDQIYTPCALRSLNQPHPTKLKWSFCKICTVLVLFSCFRENFDDEVPFRRFGYPSLDSFLHDHPNLVMVSFDGKVCYKAK